MQVHIFNFRMEKIQTLEFGRVMLGGGLFDNVEEESSKIFDICEEDDLENLKEKIFIASGIYPCEQFLFDDDFQSIAHSINLDLESYKIPKPTETTEFSGAVPIFKQFFNSRHLVQINDNESTKIGKRTYVNVLSLREISSITFSEEKEYELIYWSLVQYFPYFSPISFKAYIEKNHENYPLLYPNKNRLISKYADEERSIGKIHQFTKTDISRFNPDILEGRNNKKSNVHLVIKTISIAIQKRGKPDLENIFILLQSCAKFPVIIYQRNHVSQVKIYHGNSHLYNKNFTKGKSQSLMLITAEGNMIELRSDGFVILNIYGIIMNFKEIDAIVIQHSDNLKHKLATIKLSLFEASDMIYFSEIISLSCVVSYIFDFSVNKYAAFISGIKSSGLIYEKRENIFTWLKGSKQTYTGLNQFLYKESNEFQKVPMNSFEIVNKFSQIDVLIHNISEEDFKNFYYFIIYHFSLIQPETSNEKMNNLRLLRTIDPKNYNLPKQEENLVYATICQKPKQPQPLRKDEDLSKYAKDRLLKYWNFTKEEPMYYFCPNNAYPYPGFSVGYHKDGNCLVCCRKKKVVDGNQSKIYAECMKNHRYFPESSKNPIGYTVIFGKTLEPGRIGYLPDLVNKFIVYNIEDINIISDSVTLQLYRYNGRVYSIDRLFKITKNTKVQNILTSILAEFLNTPIWKRSHKNKELIKPIDVLNFPRKNKKHKKHYRRIVNSTDDPIFIFYDDKTSRYIVVDGMHRLANAVRLNKTEIPVKFITLKQLERCYVGKYQTDDISFISDLPFIQKGGAFIEKEPFYYLAGIQYRTNGIMMSYFFSIMYVFDYNLETFIRVINEKISTIESIGNFSASDIKNVINDIFYNSIYVEGAEVIFRTILPVLFNYTHLIIEVGDQIHVIMDHRYHTFSLDDRVVLLVHANGAYNPIVIAIPYSFGKTLQTEKRIFDIDDKITALFIGFVQQNSSQTVITLDHILEIGEVEHIMHYQGEAFAVEMNWEDNLIYIAMEPLKVTDMNYKISLARYDLAASLNFLETFSKKFGMPMYIDKAFIYNDQIVAYRINNYINFVTAPLKQLSLLGSVQLEYLNHPPTMIIAGSRTKEDPLLERYLSLESKRNDYAFFKEKYFQKPYKLNPQHPFEGALLKELEHPLKSKLFDRGIYNFDKLYLYKHKDEQIYIVL